jgi:NAD-specific glutamate dehydrogenase
VIEVARLHFALAEKLGLDRVTGRILALPRDDRWRTMRGRPCATTCTPSTPS